jgi:hypothetical protein
MVIIANPLQLLISVSYSETGPPTLIQPQSPGTFIIHVDRIQIQIDPQTQKVIGHGPYQQVRGRRR